MAFQKEMDNERTKQMYKLINQTEQIQHLDKHVEIASKMLKRQHNAFKVKDYAQARKAQYTKCDILVPKEKLAIFERC